MEIVVFRPGLYNQVSVETVVGKIVVLELVVTPVLELDLTENGVKEKYISFIIKNNKICYLLYLKLWWQEPLNRPQFGIHGFEDPRIKILDSNLHGSSTLDLPVN